MKIEIHNTRCFIREFPPKPWDKRLIKDFQRKSKDAYWIKRRTKGKGGVTNFISEKRGMFPTGLLPKVLEWAEKEGIPVKLDDRRKNYEVDLDNLQTEFGLNKNTGEPYKLRWYQEEAVRKALSGPDIGVPFRRGLISVATSGGKTLIARALIEATRVKTLFLVERVNLANQTKKKFVEEYGMKESEVGVIGGKKCETGRMVTIATIQSMNRFEDLETYEMVIVDESHHSKAKTYRTLLKSLKNCYFRYGLSGTVFSGDSLEDTYRESQFGPVLYEISANVLIGENVLSKPVIRYIEITEPICDDAGDWRDQYYVGITDNYERNRLIAKLAKNLNGKVLILFQFIEHGKKLHSLIPNAIYVDGETPMDIREKMFEGFNRSDEGIMIASTILDEGIDFERIHHLIIAGAGQSYIKSIQRLGRGLRPNDYMQINVIDFFDRTSLLLEKWSRKRMKYYANEGHKIKIFRRENSQ